jgi:hypothetical protein
MLLKRSICILVAVLAACGSGPSEIPLDVLAAEQDAYDGRVVSTQGTMIPIEDSPGADEYYVLEDNAGNRVRALPDGVARPHAHESVVVTGTFRFNPTAGRELHIDTVERSE